MEEPTGFLGKLWRSIKDILGAGGASDYVAGDLSAKSAGDASGSGDSRKGAEPSPSRALQLGLRLERALDLIEQGDWEEVRWRTGIRDPNKLDSRTVQFLPLMVTLKSPPAKVSRLTLLNLLSLDVPGAYFEGESESRCVTARIHLKPGDPKKILAKQGKTNDSRDKVPPEVSLRTQIDEILKSDLIASIELPVPVTSFEKEVRADTAQPAGHSSPQNVPINYPPDAGAGVIIGIIDDGCAFAHRNFLNWDSTTASFTSRILYLWDQGAMSPPSSGWQPVTNFYGYDLTGTAISATVNANRPNGVIEEDNVYKALNYRIDGVGSHGTHVMDIAAGNGGAPMATPGVAPQASIIFVQLPTANVENGAQALADSIQDGVKYIFDRAGNLPVVVNISYGTYAGPHDGTSSLEKVIDDLLGSQFKGRAVVVAAGNGFEADCHAYAETIEPDQTVTWNWIAKAEDPTANRMEIWYDNKGGNLKFSLTPPGGNTHEVSLGDTKPIVHGGIEVGKIKHRETINTETGGGDCVVEIDINRTGINNSTDTKPLAPSGTWKIELKNISQNKGVNDVHGWIERDNGGRPGGARRRQSRFEPLNADARYTITGFSTSEHSICVGAYNTATNEVCRYSACGPTRNAKRIPGNDKLVKPDVCAPAEEDSAGRGILSASSGRAQPTRMNGTSASAPFVAGLVARYMVKKPKEIGKDYRRWIKGEINTPNEPQSPVNPIPPLKNRHNLVDDKITSKNKHSQKAIWDYLTGAGKIGP